jgi:MoxR-like ATPase
MSELSPSVTPALAGIADLVASLASHDYICDTRLATVLFLALRMQRPLFLEGEAGVGKTELAKTLARSLGAPLIRLQCYEGLDVQQAAYEWNVARQLIEIRLAEALHENNREKIVKDIYRRELLLERPLLRALTQPVSPVLLIDEIDRADEPFEAYLLEVLAEYQLTIPELGTVKAEHPPIVIITSNRTREIRDALKRRCLYHWVQFPDATRELEIVRRRAPGASERLASQAVDYVQRMRKLDLFKLPGVAETIDWTNALVALNAISLDPESVRDTLGVLLKYQEDVDRMLGGESAHLLDELRAASILR